MKKIYILISVSALILIILITTTLILSKRLQNNKENNLITTPIPSPTTIFPPDTNIATDVTDYKKQLNKPSGFDDSILPTDAPISFFNFIQASTFPPLGMKAVLIDKTPSGEKFSPNKNYFARIEGTNLVIYDAKTSVKVREIKPESNILQTNFNWLTDNLLIFIEKENTNRHIDQIYIVKRDTGKKTYMLGSFPVPKRFNLAEDPFIYNNGQEIFIVDNENQYWQLSIR